MSLGSRDQLLDCHQSCDHCPSCGAKWIARHLGQWLNGSGQFFYGADPRYADFHRRHALIHERARRARAAADAADAADHSQALQLIQEAQEISDELLQDLQAMTAQPSFVSA